MSDDSDEMFKRHAAAFARLGISIPAMEHSLLRPLPDDPSRFALKVSVGVGTTLPLDDRKDWEVVYKDGKLVDRKGKLKLHDFGSRRIAEAMIDEGIKFHDFGPRQVTPLTEEDCKIGAEYFLGQIPKGD